MPKNVIRAYIVVEIDDDDLSSTLDDIVDVMRENCKFKVERRWGDHITITVPCKKK